jgi:AmmeMemoRadiSam system protein B
MNGSNSLRDIQAHCMRVSGELIYTEIIEKIARDLDDSYLLDNDNYREKYGKIVAEFKAAPVRKLYHGGTSYEQEPDAFRKMMDSFFAEAKKNPVPVPGKGKLTGIIAPHIDLKVGGLCSAMSFSMLEEFPHPQVFVILGTAHGLQESPFVVTKKDFDTPLGTAKTDKALVDDLVKRCGKDLTAEEETHRTEHSIEFQVLFLQYLLGSKKDFRIVPILCGSFESMVREKSLPPDDDFFHRFTSALKKTAATRERENVCFVSGADLSHIGPRYGDPQPVTTGDLKAVEVEDRDLLASAMHMDAPGFLAAIAKDADRRRVCGFPPILTMMSSMEASEGHLLRYEVWHDQQTGSAVSYAGVIFISE